MARIVTETLVDDLDGTTEQVATHEFSLDGVKYVLDLSNKNATKMRTDFLVWISAARRVGKAPKVAITKKRVPVDPAQALAKRDWLRSQGHKISTRGRIPAELERLFAEQHQAREKLFSA